jgi:hypothetical protein
MNAFRLAVFVLAALWSLGGHAASANLDDQDCVKILERWAENPDSVPQHLVDACKERLATAAPAALAAVSAPIDPCSGADAANSVLCWGPWSALAPAAAPAAAQLEFPETYSDCRAGSDIDDQCVPELIALAEPGPTPIEPPLEACTPGAPCGFATLVAGAASEADVEATGFRRFDLNSQIDGDTEGAADFVVGAGGDDEIQSVGMEATLSPRSDDYEGLYAVGRGDGVSSQLVARAVRGEDSDSECGSECGGSIALAADVWRHGSRESPRSGVFAWGIGTSAGALDMLNGQGVSLNYAGRMSGNELTQANITVNFGSQANWTGAWTNPNWNFNAGGAVSGVNLQSNPAQFSSNVQSGVVQGALVGEPGQAGLVHLIDVTLQNQGHIKDVGLLREMTQGPGPSLQP